MSDPLLSSLCTICHVHPHKYRCPQCFTLTCSLPCTKRHKQWAQCNGVRDPAKYVKRAELATPKGIDHDYNYLTSIERELDHAEKNVTSRGFMLEEAKRRSKHPVKGETQFNSALERCGVIIAKAPKGMTRSKQNQTICSKKNRKLQWTVEWVHPDGRKTLDKVWEMHRISAAYDDHLSYLDTSRLKKKWKPSTRHKDRISTEVLCSALSAKDPAVETKPKESPLTNAAGKRKREMDSPNMDEPAEKGSRAAAADLGTSDAVQSSTSIISSSTDPPVTKKEPISKFSFYLHHPSLPSRHTVLIPLPLDAVLATSLINRLILEFPTIYVLHSQPDGKLPEGLVTEEKFFAASKKELIEEVAGEGTQIAGSNRTSDEGKADMEDGEVDEGRLLEVLGKDLNGIAGSL